MKKNSFEKGGGHNTGYSSILKISTLQEFTKSGYLLFWCDDNKWAKSQT